MCVCVSARVCVLASAHVRARVCVCARVCAHVCERACVCVSVPTCVSSRIVLDARLLALCCSGRNHKYPFSVFMSVSLYQCDIYDT